jgi:AraC-like DNA-binding protein
VPVVIGSTHVATLLAGQVFTHQPTPRLFRAVREQLRKVGLDDEVPRLRRAWLKTRVIPANRLATSVHLLVLLVRLIAECAERWVMCAHETDPPCIARAKEFIERHAHEAMSLEDVTEHVHFCPQYFCKLFKKATGLSFTQYLSRVRVERAKQLLLDPSLRIKEAAFKAGFRSLRRFEEVFRAHTGFSPLHYRAKIPRR